MKKIAELMSPILGKGLSALLVVAGAGVPTKVEASACYYCSTSYTSSGNVYCHCNMLPAGQRSGGSYCNVYQYPSTCSCSVYGTCYS